MRNSSIQDNVLFGCEMKGKRYAEVVKACELDTVFNKYDDGDQTILGKHEVTLSEGDCQRVALARAIYSDADIYLLDACLRCVLFLDFPVSLLFFVTFFATTVL